MNDPKGWEHCTQGHWTEFFFLAILKYFYKGYNTSPLKFHLDFEKG
jgi:hypothetical protein